MKRPSAGRSIIRPRIYDPVTGRDIPARIEGHTATIAVRLDDWDFTWLAARRPGSSALCPLVQAADGDVERAGAGRENAPGAALPPSRFEPQLADGACRELGAGPGAFAARRRICAVETGDDDPLGREGKGRRLRGPYRQDFALPRGWETESVLELAIRGDVHDNRMHGFQGKNAIYLNGQPCWSGGQLNSLWLDVTAQANPVRTAWKSFTKGRG